MKIKINLNIFLFVALFVLTRQIELYALVMLFALIHELGHLVCGLLLGFTPVSLRILPMGFAVQFKINIKDYNHKIGKSSLLTLKKLAINIAGPFTNILILIIASVLHWNANTIYANLIIFFWNMMPVYPLDGGRIVHNLAKIMVGNYKARKIANHISNYFAIGITVVASMAIYYYQNIAIFLAVAILWSLLLYENRRFNTYNKIYKTIDKQENYS